MYLCVYMYLHVAIQPPPVVEIGPHCLWLHLCYYLDDDLWVGRGDQVIILIYFVETTLLPHIYTYD